MIYRNKNTGERIQPVPDSIEEERLRGSDDWERVGISPVRDPTPEEVEEETKKVHDAHRKSEQSGQSRQESNPPLTGDPGKMKDPKK